MARLQPDGHPLREHLAVAAKRSQAARARLEAPPIPEACAYIWADFRALHFGRTYANGVPNPISYREIAAWAVLTRRRPSSFELEWLRLIDAAFLVGEADGTGSEHQP